jgi:hypothetical protein
VYVEFVERQSERSSKWAIPERSGMQAIALVTVGHNWSQKVTVFEINFLDFVFVKKKADKSFTTNHTKYTKRSSKVFKEVVCLAQPGALRCAGAIVDEYKISKSRLYFSENMSIF